MRLLGPKRRGAVSRMTRLRALFLTPAMVLMVVTIAAPMVIVCAYSVLTRGAYGGVELPWTWESYSRFFDPLYGTILLRSFAIAAIATALCVGLGFPLALYIAQSGARKNLYLSLVILPFWTSFLIRLYAWMFLLRDTGLINTVLESWGWIRAPLPMLYTNGAVVLGLVYGFLPFAVLPMYATLERLDRNLLEAAADLGARPFSVLMRVTIPLCAPGIGAAAILVFVPCLGTYIASDLLGGSKTILIGNLVQNQFTTARDWPFGAAVSMILMAIAVGLLLSVRGRGEELL
jgi:spermidine/putrescine transport system permease protein